MALNFTSLITCYLQSTWIQIQFLRSYWKNSHWFLRESLQPKDHCDCRLMGFLLLLFYVIVFVTLLTISDKMFSVLWLIIYFEPHDLYPSHSQCSCCRLYNHHTFCVLLEFLEDLFKQFFKANIIFYTSHKYLILVPPFSENERPIRKIKYFLKIHVVLYSGRMNNVTFNPLISLQSQT